VETQGDFGVAALLAAQHLPALLAVISELVTELPVLKDLQDVISQHMFKQCGFAPFAHAVPPHCGPRGRHCHGGGAGGGFGPFGGAHGPFGGGFGPFSGGPGPFGGGHGPFGHGPHGGHGHHGPHGGFGQGHPGVVCDGCASDEALKAVSQREGHLTHRGFIRGNRYKSHSVHDFDLCESCKNNATRFPDSAYGPFSEINPPGEQTRGQKRYWGWQRQQCAPDQHSWRHHGRHHHEQHEEVPAATSASENPWDAMKEVLKKGAEAFAEATQGQTSELSDIARAIAESLKDAPAAAAAPVETKYAEVPVAEAKVVEPLPQAQEPTKAEQDPFVKWAQQLSQLQTLGFDRLETYIEFLEEEKGDLERVVNRIVRRDM